MHKNADVPTAHGSNGIGPAGVIAGEVAPATVPGQPTPFVLDRRALWDDPRVRRFVAASHQQIARNRCRLARVAAPWDLDAGCACVEAFARVAAAIERCASRTSPRRRDDAWLSRRIVLVLSDERAQLDREYRLVGYAAWIGSKAARSVIHRRQNTVTGDGRCTARANIPKSTDGSAPVVTFLGECACSDAFVIALTTLISLMRRPGGQDLNNPQGWANTSIQTRMIEVARVASAQAGAYAKPSQITNLAAYAALPSDLHRTLAEIAARAASSDRPAFAVDQLERDCVRDLVEVNGMDEAEAKAFVQSQLPVLAQRFGARWQEKVVVPVGRRRMRAAPIAPGAYDVDGGMQVADGEESFDFALAGAAPETASDIDAERAAIGAEVRSALAASGERQLLARIRQLADLDADGEELTRDPARMAELLQQVRDYGGGLDPTA